MKIWYQTMTSYRYDPLWDDYGKIMEEQCRKVARPDTEIYVSGVPRMIPEVDQYKAFMLWNYSSQGLNNMFQAEKKGYDAVVIGCSYDVGLDEGRELLSIPVVGITHACLHAASMLGELYAIVSCTPYLYEQYRQMIVKYGLQQKFLRGNYIYNITEADLAKSVKDPASLAKKFRAMVDKAIEDGASVVIPTPVLVSQVFYKTGWPTQEELGGALLLNPVALAVKMAEFFVDMKKIGMEVSRKLRVYGHPSKELIKKAVEAFTPGFKIEY